VIRYVALLALVAACGRWRFDEISRDDAGMPDVVTGHDEDGDGLPDVVDRCPQIAGDNADADGDGVGDACDPNPGTPTERITLFATMQPGDVPFSDMPGWVQNADSIFGNVNPGGVPATNALPIARALGTARIDVRFTIMAINGTSADQHQVACGLEGTVPFYFAELNDNAMLTQHYLGITSYDATNGYQSIDQMDVPGGLHTGPGLLRLDANATARTWSVQAGWLGELYTASGSTAAYTGSTTIRFVINGLDVDLQSVTIVETQ
jgi:hypothetical protein